MRFIFYATRLDTHESFSSVYESPHTDFMQAFLDAKHELSRRYPADLYYGCSIMPAITNYR